MKVAFASCAAMPDGSPDDHPVAALIGAEWHPWDDESVDWLDFDRVVVRTVWDYSTRLDEFLRWCRVVGSSRLRNSPQLVAFNSDKRYLAELAVAPVPTIFVAPGDSVPALDGEVVVKPNISAGARNTGRFTPDAYPDALALIDVIRSSGRTALVQPYLPAVDAHGETAIVFIGGALSHVLHKRAVLTDPGIAPLADHELAPAAAMFDPDLVVAGSATDAERSAAAAVVEGISARFGVPLYARVDLVTGADGVPAVMELEVIEPNLYLATAPGAAERMAAAIRAS